MHLAGCTRPEGAASHYLKQRHRPLERRLPLALLSVNVLFDKHQPCHATAVPQIEGYRLRFGRLGRVA